MKKKDEGYRSNNSTLEEIKKRMDLIIYLLLDIKKQEGKKAKEIIKELSEWGLKDYEIANILGKTRSYIASELSKTKKSLEKGEDKK